MPKDLLFCAPAGKNGLKRAAKRCSLQQAQPGRLAKVSVWECWYLRAVFPAPQLVQLPWSTSASGTK